jgi:hypothetical protein
MRLRSTPPSVSERPAVDVLPRLEDAQHAIELAREALRPALDATTEPVGVLGEPLGCGRGLQVHPEAGAGRHRMRGELGLGRGAARVVGVDLGLV